MVSPWNVKELVRAMITSAAYRQSAAVTPEKLERDPYNRLLTRGPRFRVEGEVVRDIQLAASGLLILASRRRVSHPEARDRR